MESSSFYMILPSSTKNSDDIYPSNTASAFQIRLPKTIYLKNKYEVALAEIMYPHSWSTFNVKEECTFKYANANTDTYDISIPQGYYTRVGDVCRELNRAFDDTVGAQEAGDLVFAYDKITRMVKVHLKPGVAFVLQQGLCDILGFQYDKVYRATLTAPYIADITRGFNSLYVYCSICQPQIVGDAYVPLLRTVFMTGYHGQMVNNIYDAPHYVPINTDSFDTIEINIKNDMNENVSFTTGKVICKLHFRQKAL